MKYESVFKKVLFPGYETLVKRRSTAAYIAEYERSQWLPRSEIDAIQLHKLNLLLDHCWRNVPFLKRHWEAHGARPGPLAALSELEDYPTLTKAQIRANYEDMTALPWRGRTLTKTTGGSTGEPFRFEYTMDAYARRTAVMWRGYGWAGAGLGVKTAYLWGAMRKVGLERLKDNMYHGAFNRRFFNAFSLSAENIDERIEELVAYRPTALVGYVAPVVLLAKHILATNRKVEGIRSVLTGAEALHEAERQVIERAFGCPVFNTYGSREVMLMAAECSQHAGLHVNADHLVLETIDPGGRPMQPGVSGDVAITDLHNFGMPMVRYLNGDRATYSAVACGCGRGLPLLSSVDGRVLDLIETPDGRHVPGEFFVYAMLEHADVEQWQVVQTAPDHVEFHIVVADAWPQERRARLVEKAQDVMGLDMRVDIVEVDSIPTGVSGKRRLTVSLARSMTAAAD